MSTLTRGVYRAQVDSEVMKKARWYAETELQPKLQPKRVTRNALLNTPVRLLEDRGTERTIPADHSRIGRALGTGD